MIRAVNPFYAARCTHRAASLQRRSTTSLPIEKRVIGNATLYRADCFDLLPTLSGIGAVVTDPPYGIGFAYRRLRRRARQVRRHDGAPRA